MNLLLFYLTLIGLWLELFQHLGEKNVFVFSVRYNVATYLNTEKKNITLSKDCLVRFPKHFTNVLEIKSCCVKNNWLSDLDPSRR